MTSPIDLPVPLAPRFRAGQRQLSARALNTLAELTGSVLPGDSLGLLGELAGITLQFKLVSVDGDHIICHYYDGTTEGTVAVTVSKAWHLRRTPFDGLSYNGISYSYNSDVERVADATETQVVVPPYVAGDVVTAELVPNGFHADPTETTIKSFFVETTTRVWAEKAT